MFAIDELIKYEQRKMKTEKKFKKWVQEKMYGCLNLRGYMKANYLWHVAK